MSYKHNPELTAAARRLRKEQTKEERRLWYRFLRTYPLRFLRQKVIDDYIVDFYCAKAKLVVELDGSQHYEEKGREYDLRRTEALERRGLRVIRIPNNKVMSDFEGVCSFIDQQVKESPSQPDG